MLLTYLHLSLNDNHNCNRSTDGFGDFSYNSQIVAITEKQHSRTLRLENSPESI